MGSIAVLDAEPVGFYRTLEAARIVGVPVERLRYWTREGFVAASQSARPVAVYSFQDVAEALSVSELFRRGVEGHHLSGVLKRLRPIRGRWPLTRSDLATETLIDSRGKHVRTVIVEEHASGYWDFDRRGMQGFEVAARERLEPMVDVLEAGGWPSRARDLQAIEIDPERLGGRPALRGHRLPVEFVADLAATAEGREELGEYDLDADVIEQAVRWWQTSQAALA